LQGLIGADGHIAYASGQDQTPVWVTAQAELALTGKTLPLAAEKPAAVVPVNHKSPARRTRPVLRSSPHRRRTPRAKRVVAVRTVASPAVQRLGADAGALTALLLAPVGI
jgi:hypothetical protein